jgi:hypothetical protein
MVTHRLKRGLIVLDAQARVVGRVEGTFPLDGGNDPDFAIVRIRRFGGEKKLLPIGAARVHPGAVQVPYSSEHISEAPEYDDSRAHYDQAAHARSFWGEHADDDASRLGYRRLAALRD